MKRILGGILVLALLLLVCLPGCGNSAREEGPTGTETPKSAEGSKPPAIRPLAVKRVAAELTAVGKVEPWEDYWLSPRTVKDDLSGAPGLAYSLIMGDDTYFAAALPQGYDPEALLEWGKEPGLNVDILHAHGFTGKGAVIAYIDQPVVAHGEYDRENIHVTNTGEQTLSMHGPAVLSLLAGESIGVAPEAEVYYFGLDSGKGEGHRLEVEGLRRVMALNETLPEGEKINMVGFSHNIDSSLDYAEDFRATAEACQEAGIMVWFCGENGAVSFLPYADKNNPDNLMIDQWGGGLPSLAYVPSSGRTVAATVGLGHYIYFSTGGLSWTMPYVLGLYAIAVSIDPSLTQEELRWLNVDTAYAVGEMRIINPVGFVAAVLDKAGRSGEAQALREEAVARQKYLYAAVNLETMSREDLYAIYDYLAWITEAKVIVADASRFADAGEMTEAIQADLRERGGSIAGIQLFGDEGAVPRLPGEGGNGESPILRLALEPGKYPAFFAAYLEAVRAGDLDTPESYAEALFTPNYAAMALSDAVGSLG